MGDSDSSTGSDTSVDTDSDSFDKNDTAGDSEFPVEIDTEFETDPRAVVLHEPCTPDRYLGGFKVEMNVDGEYSFVEGTVNDIPNPSLVVEETAEDGSCRLLRLLKKPRLDCDPPCASGTTCGLDEICQPMPTRQDVGWVVVQGLVKTVVMAPVPPGNSYFDTRLPHPGFEPNKVIRLTTTDGEMGTMELYGIGVYPLGPMREPLVFSEHTDLLLVWDAPPDEVRSVMHVEMSIDLHGVTPVNLVCNFPDTGTATVSSEMVDLLIAAGVSGFPRGIAARRTLDSMETDAGCVDFQVRSVATLTIEVLGYIPCRNDSDCTLPETCNLETQQCG